MAAPYPDSTKWVVLHPYTFFTPMLAYKVHFFRFRIHYVLIDRTYYFLFLPFRFHVESDVLHLVIKFFLGLRTLQATYLRFYSLKNILSKFVLYVSNSVTSTISNNSIIEVVQCCIQTYKWIPLLYRRLHRELISYLDHGHIMLVTLLFSLLPV